jgi:hypothetical protein
MSKVKVDGMARHAPQRAGTAFILARAPVAAACGARVASASIVSADA